MFCLIILSLFFLAFSESVSADYYLSNSREWTDVYSVQLFGMLNDAGIKFLVGPKHGALITNEMVRSEKVNVISSENSPIIFGVGTLFENEGFNVEENTFENVNLGLAEMLQDNITSFIVMDSSYPYNAVALAPYASLTDSFVIFADRGNIDDVVDYLDSREVTALLLYGTLDKAVRDELAKYSPDVINEDGDKFANNVEIVKRFRAIKNTGQVVMSNGGFLEESFFDDRFPLIFVGASNVPEVIRNYVQSSGIEVGVLVGNELVGTATVIRRQLGISVFVKYGRSARAPDETITQVEGLDLFYLPVYQPNLQIVSVRYNKISKQLEVTLNNPAEVSVYLKGTYTINYGTNRQLVVGDVDILFLDAGDTKTIVYDIDEMLEGDLKVDAYILLGESKNSLEYILEQSFDIETIEVLDDSAIDAVKAVYDKTQGKFVIEVQNIGTVPTFVSGEIIDIMVEEQERIIASDKVIKVEKGESGDLEFTVAMSDEDLAANPEIDVKLYYGQREKSLIKVLNVKLAVAIKSFDMWTYIPILIIAFLVIIIFLTRRRKKEEKDQRIRF